MKVLTENQAITRRGLLTAAGSGLAALALPGVSSEAQAQQAFHHVSPLAGIIRQPPSYSIGYGATNLNSFAPNYYNSVGNNSLFYLLNASRYWSGGFYSFPYASGYGYNNSRSPLYNNSMQSGSRNRGGSLQCCCQATNNQSATASNNLNVRLAQFKFLIPKTKEEEDRIKTLFAAVHKHLIEDFGYQAKPVAVDYGQAPMDNLLYYLMPTVLIHDQFTPEALAAIDKGIGKRDPDLIPTYSANQQFFRDVLAIVKFSEIEQRLIEKPARPETVDKKEEQDSTLIANELKERVEWIQKNINPNYSLDVQKKAEFIAKAYNRLDDSELRDIAEILKQQPSHHRDLYAELFTGSRPMFTRSIGLLNQEHGTDKIKNLVNEDRLAAQTGPTGYDQRLFLARHFNPPSSDLLQQWSQFNSDVPELTRALHAS